MAAQKLYDFIWSELCDWYLNWPRRRFYGDDENAASATRATLKYVLVSTLKLLHPSCPFLTEEIYLYLPFTSGSIMVSSWPKVGENFPQEAAAMQHIMDVVSAVRNLRAGMNVPRPERRTSTSFPRKALTAASLPRTRLLPAPGPLPRACRWLSAELPRNVVSGGLPLR